jgi:hypothetical protein
MCAALSFGKHKKYLCPICGYYLEYPPEDFNICPSCGVEFGYETASRSSEELRKEWLSTGARWASNVENEPNGWDAMLQLANLGVTSNSQNLIHDTNATILWEASPYSLTSRST